MEWRVGNETAAGNRGKTETPQAQRGGSASSPRKASVRSVIERACSYNLVMLKK
ncbi:hypothetical protein P8864_00380 [Priestia flexa]|uniref:hypothetical protein n=1 Tax=Priestia flexa TaxID=86664 RepID=UPI002DBEC68F|nr:hypothetical protein [Priestia flexa]MEC0664420.1 hypothetical protein [Priestia flexa]